jgi:SAM-dependent methyltransferase
MIEILGYIVIGILLCISYFFLVRTIVILITMFTEVPYKPSNKAFKEAVEYLDIKEGDKVIDIGCGDGRVIKYAAKRYPKAQFVGIDRNFFLIAYAKFLSLFSKSKNLSFHCVNAHEYDISSFNKIYLFLLTPLIDTLLSENRDHLKKGCTVVSFHYGFSKDFFGINNTDVYPVKYKGKEEKIYKWINK